jgi:SP family sugar:H+ symporter-like MFS transporter
MQLFNVTGICLSFFVNYGINIQIKSLSSAKWRIPFALQMLPGVLLLLGIVFQNESPRWLVEKNRFKDAAKALATVRGKPVDDRDVVQELDEIVADFHGHEKLPLSAQLKAACANKRMFYQTSFAVILMFWQQWTGTYMSMDCVSEHLGLRSVEVQIRSTTTRRKFSNRLVWLVPRPVSSRPAFTA